MIAGLLKLQFGKQLIFTFPLMMLNFQKETSEIEVVEMNRNSFISAKPLEQMVTSQKVNTEGLRIN